MVLLGLIFFRRKVFIPIRTGLPGVYFSFFFFPSQFYFEFFSLVPRPQKYLFLPLTDFFLLSRSGSLAEVTYVCLSFLTKALFFPFLSGLSLSSAALDKVCDYLSFMASEDSSSGSRLRVRPSARESFVDRVSFFGARNKVAPSRSVHGQMGGTRLPLKVGRGRRSNLCLN